MALTHPTGAKTRWLFAAVAAVVLLAEPALAIPQAQTGGGAGGARRCGNCAQRDSLRRTRDQLVLRIDSLKWEIENRRLTETERALVAKEIGSAIRALELALTEEAVQESRAAVESRRSSEVAGYAIQTAFRPRGYLGVTFDGAMAERQHPTERIVRFFQYPRIALVDPGSPAERGGVLAGDTVLALNGEDLFEREISFTKMLVPNEHIVMRVRREGSPRDLKVVVGEAPEFYVRRISPSRAPQVATTPRPGQSGSSGGVDQVRVYGQSAPTPPAQVPAPSMYWFGNDGLAGARLETLSEGLAKALKLNVREGVLILRAAEGTPSHRSGLRDGDIVVRAGGNEVNTVAGLRRALAQREGDGEIRLDIVREGKRRDVTLRWR